MPPNEWFWLCGIAMVGTCGSLPAGQSTECLETPEECAAMYTYYQQEVAQLCEEYPEECQQAFDSWLEASDAEAEE